jgi:hypothetical protein
VKPEDIEALFNAAEREKAVEVTAVLSPTEVTAVDEEQ